MLRHFLPALMILMLPYAAVPVRGQKIITTLDTALINKAAMVKLNSFVALMGSINYETEPVKVRNFISTVFRNQIFVDSNVSLEDDLDPTIHTAGGFQLPVPQYLRNFDLYCEKPGEESEVQPVAISVIATAPLRRNKHGYYLRIYYNEQFNTRHTVKPEAYTVNTRVADFVVTQERRRWMAYISSMGFMDLNAIPAEMAGTDDLVEVLVDSSAIREMMSEKELMEREAEREHNKFAALEDAGMAAEEAGNYIDAYIFYNEMAALKPLDRKPRSHIAILRKALQKEGKSPDDYFYAGFMEKGRLAAGRSYDYDKAINYYERATDLRPALTDTIGSMIAMLREKYKQQQFLEARYKEHKYEDARKGYEDAIKADPKNSDLYYGLARCLQALDRKKEKVVDAYSQAITLNDHNLQAIIGLADYYQSLNEYASALAQYKVYLSYDRNNPEIYVQMAALKIRQNKANTGEALQDIDEAIRIHPDAATLYITKGQILYRNENYKEALSLFNKAVAKDPYSAMAYYHLGLGQIAMGNIPEAAKAFSEARSNKLDTAANNSINDIAQQFYLRSQNNQEHYRKYNNAASMDSARLMIGYAIILSPGTAAYYSAQGSLNVLQQKYREAIQDYTEAINRNRGYTAAYIQRGQTYLDVKQYDTALNDFSLALSQCADNKSDDNYVFAVLPAAKGRCDALFYLHRYPDAIREYTALLQKIKDAPARPSIALQAETHHYLGSAYLETGDLEQAISEVKEAIRFNEHYAAAYFTRGLIYKRKGKLSDAIEDVKKALDIDKAQARWNFELGELSRQKEDYAYAAQCYTAAMMYAKGDIPTAIYNRGYCNYKLDEYSIALADYRRARQAGLDKRMPGAFNNEMGYLYARSGLLDSAYQCYYTAYTENQLDADACFGLGAIAYLKNRSDEETYYTWFDKAFQRKKLDEDYIRRHPPLIGSLKDEKRYKELVRKYY